MDLQQLATAAGQHFADARPLIPMYIHLILSALFPIYTGAHASLSRPSSAAKPVKKEKASQDGEGEDDADDEEDEEDDVVQKMEGLSPKDAIVFPVTAGIVLAGLYFLIKRYGADLINLILGWYFSGVGVYSVAKLVNDGSTVLLSFLLPTYFGCEGKLWKAVDNEKYVAQNGSREARTSPVPSTTMFTQSHHWATIWSIRAAVKRKYTTKAYIHDVFDFHANLTLINALSALFGVASIAYANLVAKPWWLTNLQGFAVCYSALQIMSPTTFATGSLILSGLFCYDIWAVFFTPLMVTVAKNLDQPIKLVFPRPDQPSDVAGEPPIKSFSMLGLGDIVLPGIMIGLALRFDLYLFYLKKQQERRAASDAPGENTDVIEEMKKVPYVTATGSWGDRFWTSRLPSSVAPEKRQGALFPKPYFVASMAGYLVGMLATLGIMTVFQHAQPALLYLVPGVLLSLWGTALVRGELKQMWEFSEAFTGEQLTGDEMKDIEKKENERKVKDDRSLFGRLWEEVFGASDEKTSRKEDLRTPDPSANADKSLGAQRNDGKLKASDTLVSFSITRYNPRVASSTDASRESSNSKLEKSAPAERTQTPSDSGLEDTVVVEKDEG